MRSLDILGLRPEPTWLAIDEASNKIIGKVDHRTFIKKLHAYVDLLDQGSIQRWPPTSYFWVNGQRYQVRYEPLLPPTMQQMGLTG